MSELCNGYVVVKKKALIPLKKNFVKSHVKMSAFLK